MGTPKITTTEQQTGTDTALQITATAGTEETIFVTFIAVSVSGGTAVLTVDDGATTIIRVEVSSSSPVIIPLDHPISLSKGNDLTVDVTSAGAGNDGSLTVSYFTHNIS